MSKESTLAIAYQIATTELNPSQPGGIEAQKDAAIGSLQLAYNEASRDLPKRDRIGILRTARKSFFEKWGE